MKKNKRSGQKIAGVTLIETLVALTILLVVLVAGSQLLSTLTTANAVNRDKFSATYLAQECLEIARNTRDTNWLQNKAWYDDLSKVGKPINNKFSREIMMSWPTETEIKITCMVSWKNVGGAQQLSISQILTNWRKK